jgi:hypothetical protein
VCKIYYSHQPFQDSLLKEFPEIDKPFPELTSLELSSSQQRNVPVLPGSFLGGSAPRLRLLNLEGIPYPSIGHLLLSTTNLVRLSLRRIPHSGYISPEIIVPCLSALVRLESLELGFRHPRSRAQRANRRPPPLTRVPFPNLASLEFRSDLEYLEDILSQIETPMLNRSVFCFFNQLVIDTPLFGHFIRRSETFRKIYRARMEFLSSAVIVTFCGRELVANNDSVDREALRLEITCKPLDWQLSALAQVLYSFLSAQPTLESLQIAVSRKDWRGKIEVIQWRELLHQFTVVKKVTLESEQSIRLITLALQELSWAEPWLLPALQNLFLDTEDWRLSGPVKKAIERFVAVRQLYGHPVTVHYWDSESEEYIP